MSETKTTTTTTPDEKAEQAGEAKQGWVREQNARGKAAYRLGLAFVRENAGITVFRIVSVGISGFFGTLAISMMAVVFLMSVVGEPLDEMIWLWHLGRLIREPSFLIGAAGVLATTTAAGLLLDAYSEGMIWTAYRDARAGERAKVLSRTTHDEATRWTPTALAWLALRWAIRAGCLAVGVGVYVGILMLNLRWMQDTHALLALGTSMLYAGGILYMILLNVTLEWVPACLIGQQTEEHSLGEAFLEAAGRSIEELIGTYRLIVQSLSWALPALALAGAALAGQLLLASSDEMAQLFGLVRVFTDLFVTVSLAGVGVLIRVGLFELEADRHEEDKSKRSIQARAERAERISERPTRESIYAHLGREDEDGISRVDIQSFLPEDPAPALSMREVLPSLYEPKVDHESPQAAEEE